jgi:hypothetical protein
MPIPTAIHTTAAAKATITGTLQAVGGPAGTPNRPLPGEVTARGTGRTYSVSVGVSGHFSLAVAAGTYTIVGRSSQYQSGAVECHGTDSVSTAPNSVTMADVNCDEK